MLSIGNIYNILDGKQIPYSIGYWAVIPKENGLELTTFIRQYTVSAFFIGKMLTSCEVEPAALGWTISLVFPSKATLYMDYIENKELACWEQNATLIGKNGNFVEGATISAKHGKRLINKFFFSAEFYYLVVKLRQDLSNLY